MDVLLERVVYERVRGRNVVEGELRGLLIEVFERIKSVRSVGDNVRRR